MRTKNNNLPSTIPILLMLFNVVFLLQLVFGYYPDSVVIEQWILVFGNFILLGLGIVSARKEKHRRGKDPTLFQLLFFILLTAHAVLLLILLASKSIIFLIFMPFEFFVIGFYVGYYFLVTRHIFILKR